MNHYATVILQGQTKRISTFNIWGLFKHFQYQDLVLYHLETPIYPQSLHQCASLVIYSKHRQ